jgi:hypothetical protein
MFRFYCLFLFTLLFFLPACREEENKADSQIKPIANSLMTHIPLGENPVSGMLAYHDDQRQRATLRLRAAPKNIAFEKISVGDIADKKLIIINQKDYPVQLHKVVIGGVGRQLTWQDGCSGKMLEKIHDQCQIDLFYSPDKKESFSADMVLINTPGVDLVIPMSFSSIDAPTLEENGALKEIDVINSERRVEELIIHQDQEKRALPVEGKLEFGYPQGHFPFRSATKPVDRSYILTADRYIPAVLENMINSELPEGRIVAVIERPVFGSDGAVVLIPAGSRVIGTYSSLKKQSDSRLSVVWRRILRPDGVSITIKGYGADVVGRFGLIGDVDKRQLHKYGGAMLTSFISILPEYYLGGIQTSNVQTGGSLLQTNGKGRATDRLSKDMSYLARRMIEENLNIAPIMTIPQGTRFNIILNEDIYFDFSLGEVSLLAGEEGERKNDFVK